MEVVDGKGAGEGCAVVRHPHPVASDNAQRFDWTLELDKRGEVNGHG